LSPGVRQPQPPGVLRHLGRARGAGRSRNARRSERPVAGIAYSVASSSPSGPSYASVSSPRWLRA